MIVNYYNDILTKIILEVTCGLHRAAKTGVLPYSDVMAGSVVRKKQRFEEEKRDLEDDDANSKLGAAEGNAGIGGSTASSAADAGDCDWAKEGSHANVREASADANAAESQLQSQPVVDVDDGSSSTKRKLEGRNGDGEDTKTTSTETVGYSKISGSNNKINMETDSINTTDKHNNSNKNSNNTNNNGTGTGTGSGKPNLDIWGRPLRKEPKYQITCPNCGRSANVPRFTQHLEKCMGLTGKSTSVGSTGGSSLTSAGNANSNFANSKDNDLHHPSSGSASPGAASGKKVATPVKGSRK